MLGFSSSLRLLLSPLLLLLLLLCCSPAAAEGAPLQQRGAPERVLSFLRPWGPFAAHQLPVQLHQQQQQRRQQLQQQQPPKMLRSFLRLASAKGPLQLSIEKKLMEQLAPEFLEVINESAAHKGHLGNPDPNAPETHFLVRIRSSSFSGKTLLQQHREVYAALKEELQQGVHALSIQSEAFEK
ncbi:Transcriptional regulator bolA, related [Eimeria tenella]|uniref:Transcriptional regulator bolA, related n=1 Tax=Eimeria tenella TaxID=5802 RepID=U6L563_EIMTE|nr:Transcriptional regulator bolA, related [Eimeria tenella]CDJ45522.1 Transcriptional regulator bolA, related [Eimeria tenella]|eukprot:XP_013236268.1 Transcriptional regulator bolA, related [Eimeria tenella]